jgi:rhodanese-related sulfurtransferase
MNFKFLRMNSREKLSAGLLCLGIIVALLPLSASRSFSVKPQKLAAGLFDENSYFTVDQVARFLISEDSTVLIFDLRSQDDFSIVNIPGSINIPYSELLNEPERYFADRNTRKILYSNSDRDANYAYTILKGLNFKNVFVMKGGLNEWFSAIMNSSFSGDKISARENALYETRLRANRMFTEINSLPDSMKIKYLEAKHFAAKKLDGGCE